MPLPCGAMWMLSAISAGSSAARRMSGSPPSADGACGTSKGFGYWTVVDRETGAFLGEAGFSDFKRGIDPDLSQWPEAGWAFGRASWGRGIGSEVVRAMHAWLDQNMAGPSVCIIDDANSASRKVAEKAGYQFWTLSSLRGHPVNVYQRGF